MWTTQAKRTTTASKQQIWDLWSNVNNWPSWDTDVKKAELYGSLVTGTKGSLTPTKGPTAKFAITECTPLASFTSRTALPLCKMDFIHSMQQRKDEIEVTHKVVLTGSLAFLFSKMIGHQLKTGLPKAVDQLIAQAESKQTTHE